MGNLHIVTGYKGEAHVSAADNGALNSAIFGSGEYVLGKGNKLSASVISNNSIRIMDGEIMMQGRHIRLNEGSYVDLTIENGAQDTYRNDLIVARYTKNTNTGVEDCDLVVIKGTAVASDPSDPENTVGDLLEDHDVQNDMLLYRVPLIGLNVQTLVPLFTQCEVTFQDFGSKQNNTNSLTAETAIADGDYFPFYDTSATSNRKTLWSNILAKIKTALFGTVNGILKADGNGNLSAATIDTTPTANSTNPVTSGGVKAYAAALDSNNRVKAEQASAFRVDISSSSTLTLNHAGRFVLVNSSEAVTITVPSDSDVAWPDYTEIEFCQWGSGSVTIQGATGVGIVSMENAKTIAGQYGCCCLKKTGGSTWILAGALA